MSIASQLADALRSQESGSSSDADIRNTTGSGARGPWQIMPANWPSWARSAGLSSDAPWTLENQQRVVMNQIQRHLDAGYSPEDIAAIWYSGQPVGDNADVPQQGGPSIREYVNSVMSKLPGAGRTETGSGTVAAPPASSGTEAAPPISNIFAAPLASLIKGLQANKNKPRFVPDQPTTKPSPSGYTRSGNYQQDALGYFTAMSAASDELNTYIQQHTRETEPGSGLGIGYEFDPKTGLVYQVQANGYDTQGNPKVIREIDPEGSKIGSRLKNSSDNLDQLYAAKKAGILDSGQSAAEAYLASEKGKATESTRQLDDFMKRIEDLVSLENIPISRAQSLATTMSAINSASAKKSSRFAYEQVAPQAPQYSDLSGQISSLRGTIPGQAPAPYNVNPAAFAPVSGAVASVPIKKTPQQVLADYGYGPPDTNSAYPNGVNFNSDTGAGLSQPEIDQGHTQPPDQVNTVPWGQSNRLQPAGRFGQ